MFERDIIYTNSLELRIKKTDGTDDLYFRTPQAVHYPKME